MKLSLSVSPSGSLSDFRFFLSCSLRLCPEPWPVLLPPVKFAGCTKPPIDSLHPHDHKLLNYIEDPALGAAVLHPNGNRGSRGHVPLRRAPSSSASSSPRASAALWRGVADLLCLTADSSLRRAPRGRDGELLLHLHRGGTRGPAGTATPKRGRRGSARASSRADCHPRSPRAREGTAAGAAGSHHM